MSLPSRGGLALLVLLCCGFLTGWTEVVFLALRHTLGSPIQELSRDFVWMTPLATGAVGATAGLMLWMLAAVWSRLPVVLLALAGGVAFSVLELLLWVPRLADWAALFLAIAVGVQAARALRRRLPSLSRLMGPTVPALLLLVPVVGGGMHLGRWLAERRNLAGLAAAAAGAPNVILITLDAVRAANLSVYGYSRTTTPELARFALQGVRFDRALSTAPWTLPSHASMLTGRWPHELSTGYSTPLDATHPTLAGFLSERGYATGGFVANLRYCGYETGLNRGFIHYADYPIATGQLLSSSKVLATLLNNFRLRRWIRNDQHLTRKSAEAVNGQVLRWLDRIGRRPFFVFINYFDAHEPYLPPAGPLQSLAPLAVGAGSGARQHGSG